MAGCAYLRKPATDKPVAPVKPEKPAMEDCAKGYESFSYLDPKKNKIEMCWREELNSAKDKALCKENGRGEKSQAHGVRRNNLNQALWGCGYVRKPATDKPVTPPVKPEKPAL